MEVGNWYHDMGRHTRSDRSSKKGTIEVTWNGFRLRDPSNNKHLDITLTDKEMEETLAVLKLIMEGKKSKKGIKPLTKK